ncbi:solute carrier family 4 member 11-like [Panonychus citri]|uniref:solute carrier family 4 member 11-like n=1 Tax=Panonychus citri TaxID=50023 RepID=UPI00230808C1|nr:solute carrier family 4 member 11-like [Panonychus citri]
MDNYSSPFDREVILVQNKTEKVSLKSFKEEIRATIDVERLITETKIILDVEETSVHRILEVGLIKIIGRAFDVNQFKSTLCISENVPKLKETFQSLTYDDNGFFAYDQSWICVTGSLPFLSQRLTGIICLANPVNFGDNAAEIRFIIMVLVPIREKGTKNAFETGRTFGTLFTSAEFRNNLLQAKKASDFLTIVRRRANDLLNGGNTLDRIYSVDPYAGDKIKLTFCKGISENFIRRAKFYLSDFVDGVKGPNTFRKTLATIFFLYFACILPCVAFGVLVDKTTNGLIDARRAIIGQAIGGLIFALFAGQPLVIIATTAPLCLFTKAVYEISQDFNVDFYTMFATVGLWNSFFVIIYALFDVSMVMKWCTRNTEEIFAIFIFFAFSVDALKDVVGNFREFYPGFGCNEPIVGYMINSSGQLIMNVGQSMETTNATLVNVTNLESFIYCRPQSCLLFVLLMLGTLWLALKLFEFNKTPYLGSTNREILSDYALPISVVIFSAIGSFLFSAIETEQFKFSESFTFKMASFDSLTPGSIVVAGGLGFALSLLFFMDQNISAALVNTPYNNLKKGSGYHLDLLIVGLLNAFTALTGLPWMHGILPHSPLHARSLADIEERVENGCVKQVVVYVRETRITGIIAHILIGLSLYLIPYPLTYIPVPVLDGLFLYCAFASLRGNSFYERFLLLITEQNSYPPNHYIRRSPQKYIHYFTFIQIAQLAILCFFGFFGSPYVQMAFPIVIALLIPIRHLIVPKIIPAKYLRAIDGYH